MNRGSGRCAKRFMHYLGLLASPRKRGLFDLRVLGGRNVSRFAPCHRHHPLRIGAIVVNSLTVHRHSVFLRGHPPRSYFYNTLPVAK